MRITISGKNIDVTQGLKDTIYEKLGKLDKYFTPETEAIVTLSVREESSENRGYRADQRQRYSC